jgi:hypothetical protein
MYNSAAHFGRVPQQGSHVSVAFVHLVNMEAPNQSKQAQDFMERYLASLQQRSPRHLSPQPQRYTEYHNAERNQSIRVANSSPVPSDGSDGGVLISGLDNNQQQPAVMGLETNVRAIDMAALDQAGRKSGVVLNTIPSFSVTMASSAETGVPTDGQYPQMDSLTILRLGSRNRKTARIKRHHSILIVSNLVHLVRPLHWLLLCRPLFIRFLWLQPR